MSEPRPVYMASVIRDMIADWGKEPSAALEAAQLMLRKHNWWGYTVHVGNIGMVDDNVSLEVARDLYAYYVERSKSQGDRCTNETVQVEDSNGTLVMEYDPYQ